MDNIAKVNCIHYSHDWSYIITKEINLDEYVFFEIDYRGNSWHIKGHKCDPNYHWSEEELSEHEVKDIGEVAKFIAHANAYPKSIGKFQDCKVSRFNNLHYSDSFYEALTSLFALVKKEDEILLNQENFDSVSFMEA